MNTLQRPLLIGFGLILIGLAVFGSQQWFSKSKNESAGEDFGSVPAFKLTTQEGTVLDRSELDGKVWVADLIFTTCGTTCPVMTNSLVSIQNEFKDMPDVRFVSFSVDPDNDTPEMLKIYAESHGADLKRWTFLTGDVRTIYRVAKDGFHLGLDSVGGDQDMPIIHSEKFALVDREGRIRGYYNGTTEEGKRQLVAAAKALVQPESH